MKKKFKVFSKKKKKRSRDTSLQHKNEGSHKFKKKKKKKKKTLHLADFKAGAERFNHVYILLCLSSCNLCVACRNVVLGVSAFKQSGLERAQRRKSSLSLDEVDKCLTGKESLFFCFCFLNDMGMQNACFSSMYLCVSLTLASFPNLL